VLKRTKHIQWVDRGWYLVTEFEKTSSVNFRRAVEFAKTHPGFIQLMDERNILIYRNIYRASDLGQFQELYKLVKNWKGTKLYLKGDEVAFDSIESSVRCYIQMRLVNGDRPINETCENFDRSKIDLSSSLGSIGCRRSEVRMAWNLSLSADIPSWFFFGSLDRHKVYQINKEDLENAVIGHLFEYQHCPLLDLDQVTALIRRLPDRIDPRKDKEWKYHQKQQTGMNIGYYKEPDILPISEDAYRAYLQRKLQQMSLLCSLLK
jgi:hypothetical protein